MINSSKLDEGKMKQVRCFSIRALQEYRFELDRDERISIRLLRGTAEIEGLELSSNQTYQLGDELRSSIFSWHGCDLEVIGRASTDYVAEESTIPTYFALHLALEKLRLSSVQPRHFLPIVQPPTRLKNSSRSLNFSTSSNQISYQNENNQNSYQNENNQNSYQNDIDSRVEDLNEERPGPRVMVIGTVSSGKSTLIKTLANWAVRSGRTKLEGPGLLLVNLDPNNGGFTIPGTFSIAPLNVSIPTTTSVLPLGSTPTTGPPVIINQPMTNQETSIHNSNTSSSSSSSSLKKKNQQVGSTVEKSTNDQVPNPSLFAPALNALTFYYGHSQLGRNLDQASALIKRMGTSLEARIENSCETALWRGGVLVDCPAEFSDKGKSHLVKETVRAFGINVLVVLGSERLYLEIKKLMNTNKTVEVIRVPKNGGATDLDLNYRKRLESNQIRSYFYGGPSLSQGQLSPFTIVVKFDDLSIFRIGGDEAQVPSSALPLGATSSLKPTSLIRIDLSVNENSPNTTAATTAANKIQLNNLINLILCIPQSDWDGVDVDSEAADQASTGPSLGFVHLSGIDLKNKKFTILSPLPGRLPRRVAIAGSLEWIDG
ncbi:Pre-mRNA cleavage complex II protein Clp1-domain-containing protein [Phakopsora pachyrhizi]|nr:Pre-mRNA cleavage complex II protein Clp1-domain-containing protein [Phakopsora pachyrhizi]